MVNINSKTMTPKITYLFSLLLCFAFATQAQTNIDFSQPFSSNSLEIIKKNRVSRESLPDNLFHINNPTKSKNLNRRTKVDLPTKSKFYEWVSNNWAYEYDKRYEYSDDGLLIKESVVEIEDSTEIILFQKVFTYNYFGAKTSETHFSKQDSVLKPIEKDSFGYTPYGNLILQEYYEWDDLNSEWKREGGWKYTVVYEGGNLKSRTLYQFYNTYEKTVEDEYTYEGKKILTHIRTTFHGGHINQRVRWTYIYQGDILKQTLVQEFENGDFRNRQRTTIDSMIDYNIDKLDKIIIWYTLSMIYDTKMTGLTEEASAGSETWFKNKRYVIEWDNNDYKNLFHNWNEGSQSWVSYAEISRTITGNKSVTLIRELYQGIWYDDYRETRVTGINGEEIEFKREYYYENWDSWDVIFWYRLEKTYNTNGVLQEIVELELDPFNYILVNHSKEEFTSWEEVNIGVQTPIAINNFKVSPNPTSNYFVVSNKGSESYNITIRSITGAIVYSAQDQSADSRLNINDLGMQSGLYVIVIENTNNSTIEIHKLLVE